MSPGPLLPNGDNNFAVPFPWYHAHMHGDDMLTTTDRDLPRPAATTSDNSDFTLSIEEVAERYAKAGHPRTIRTLQRYCVSGHLDARKVATTLGDKYLVSPQSVARHIAQIVEMLPLDTVATDRDPSRLVATPVTHQEPPSTPTTPVATVNNQQRQAPTVTPDMSRYVARLEHDLERAEKEIDTKNKQIADLLERDKETNYLVRGLQNMIAPFLGAGRQDPPPSDHHIST